MALELQKLSKELSLEWFGLSKKQKNVPRDNHSQNI